MTSTRPATGRFLWATALALLALAVGTGHAQTGVRTVQPSALTIEAGGVKGELVVQGSGLDQVRSIEVTLSGRLFAGVSGAIARSSSAELVLSLGAAGDIRSTSGLRVVLVTARERIEIPAMLDVVVSPPPPEPTPMPPSPVGQSAGLFLVTLAAPAMAAPPDPVTHAVGLFLVVVAGPVVASAPPEPVTAAAGTFVVTIAPPGSGGN
jgi:hypothetical protein